MKIFAKKIKGKLVMEAHKDWQWYAVGFTIKQRTFGFVLRIKK